GVVERLNVLEDAGSGLGTGLVVLVVDQLLFQAGEEGRRFFYDVALPRHAAVLGPEVADLVLQGAELAVAGEGLVALVVQGLLPGAEQGFVNAQRPGGLRHRVALLGQQLDRFHLELAGVVAALLWHSGPPKMWFALLSRCPSFVGKSRST